jgi:hypothetical protein
VKRQWNTEDVNIFGARAELACWAEWADLDWKREETWAKMDKPDMNKYFEYLPADLNEFK